MGYLVGIVIPIALCGLAFVLGRHEQRAYRDSDEFDSDLFLYTKGRLYRRMTGVGLLVAVAFTLAAMEFFPASTPSGATVYLALLVAEILALLVLPLFDLRETSTTKPLHEREPKKKS